MQAIETLQKIVGLDDEVFSDIVPHINKLIELGLNPSHAACLFFSSLGVYDSMEYKLKTSAGLFPVLPLIEQHIVEIKTYLAINFELESQRANELVDGIVKIVNEKIDETKKVEVEKAHRELMSSLERDSLNDLESGVYIVATDDFVSIIEDGFNKWKISDNNIELKKDMIANPSNYWYGEGYSKYGDDAGVVIRGTLNRISKGVSSKSYMKYGAKYGVPKEIAYDGDTLFLARYDDFYLMAVIDM